MIQLVLFFLVIFIQKVFFSSCLINSPWKFSSSFILQNSEIQPEINGMKSKIAACRSPKARRAAQAASRGVASAAAPSLSIGPLVCASPRACWRVPPCPAGRWRAPSSPTARRSPHQLQPPPRGRRRNCRRGPHGSHPRSDAHSPHEHRSNSRKPPSTCADPMGMRGDLSQTPRIAWRGHPRGRSPRRRTSSPRHRRGRSCARVQRRSADQQRWRRRGYRSRHTHCAQR